MLKRFFDRDSTWHLPLLAGAVFLLNLLFKGFYLDSQPIAGDEPFSIYMAGMSPRDIVRGTSTSVHRAPLETSGQPCLLLIS